MRQTFGGNPRVRTHDLRIGSVQDTVVPVPRVRGCTVRAVHPVHEPGVSLALGGGQRRPLGANRGPALKRGACSVSVMTFGGGGGAFYAVFTLPHRNGGGRHADSVSCRRGWSAEAHQNFRCMYRVKSNVRASPSRPQQGPSQWCGECSKKAGWVRCSTTGVSCHVLRVTCLLIRVKSGGHVCWGGGGGLQYGG